MPHRVTAIGRNRFATQIRLPSIEALADPGARQVRRAQHICHEFQKRLTAVGALWQYGHTGMKIKPKSRYEARAKIAKALAHPTRLLLLDALRQNDLCVCEMTELAGLDQSTVSKHLVLLREAGLVGMEKKGSMSVFSLRCQCLDGFFGCMETVLQQNLKDQQELVTL